jgi:hypothetical protein
MARLAFSDTSGLSGILQLIEFQMGFPSGYITGDTNRLKQWTALINQSVSSAWDIIFDIAYNWNPDDINHTDYPIQFFNLVSGQREYSFTETEDGQEILEILKVAVKDNNGVFHEIPTLDQQSRQSSNNDVSSFIDGQNASGTPTRYDKTATGIFVDPIPNYSSTNGVKIFVQREGSYFTTASTTKTPGFSGAYHEWCVFEPCYKQALASTLVNKISLFEREMTKIEQKMRTGYSRRDRDALKRLKVNNSGANSCR